MLWLWLYRSIDGMKDGIFAIIHAAVISLACARQHSWTDLHLSKVTQRKNPFSDVCQSASACQQLLLCAAAFASDYRQTRRGWLTVSLPYRNRTPPPPRSPSSPLWGGQGVPRRCSSIRVSRGTLQCLVMACCLCLRRPSLRKMRAIFVGVLASFTFGFSNHRCNKRWDEK